MFIGHLAVGFAEKRAAPRASLPMLLFAASFVDVLWALFILGGVEAARIQPGATKVVPLEFLSYPWSHSLLMTAVWAVLFAVVYRQVTGYRRESMWLGAAVLSHWFLDFASHRADMQLAPGLPARFGLGLYNSVPATMIVEGILFALGVYLYAGATRPIGRRGMIIFSAFIGFILLLYAGSIFGPPPPNMKAVAIGDLMFLPSLLWAAWVDRTRVLDKFGAA